MIWPVTAGWLLAGLTAAGPGAPPAPAPVAYAQVTVQQRVIIRIPATQAPSAAPVTKWKEKRGPSCVAIADLGGAAFIEEDSVDLFLKGGHRLRAQFESSCPALDYYSGFYMRPTEDGRVCAGRDVIHSRAGGECQIKRFRRLIPDE